MILDVKVTPYASKNEILRWEDNRLVLKIQGVPEKGKVNENLIAFLARILKIPKSDIHILTGETSRLKKLNIQGMSLDTVKAIVSEKE
jgi:uncharacterized protein (TIGR00251 family)